MTSKILSLVVPVYKLAPHIEHLETELSKLDRADVQIILVDDGSTDGTAAALADLASVWDDIVVITRRENRGAGVARNIGFPHATGTYTLFFDADDFLHPEMIFHTIDALDRSGANASINLYDFIRDESDVATGMNMLDRHIWKEYAQVIEGDVFHITQAPEFLRFTNFPWNKLIRTAHFKAMNLTPFFGETKVNNDIQGHWNILLNANELIVSDRKIVTHRISGARDHLSKQFGRERLEIFAALDLLYKSLKSDPDVLQRFGGTYWAFVRQMTEWAASRLDEPYQDEFRRRRRDLVYRISLEELRNVRRAGEGDTYQWLLEFMD